MLWINNRKWTFYDSNGNWYADHEDNPDSFLGNRDLVEVPEMSFTSGITRQCLGNVFDDAETMDRMHDNEERHRFGRTRWPEHRRPTTGSRESQEEQDRRFNFREGTGSMGMRMRRGGRSRRNIKKNKSKRRRSRKTIRRRRRR